jgi:hypothetical protein
MIPEYHYEVAKTHVESMQREAARARQVREARGCGTRRSARRVSFQRAMFSRRTRRTAARLAH